MLTLYRIAHWLWLKRVPLFPQLLKLCNRVLFAVVLPPSASIGKGVLFSYSGLGTVVHKRAVIEDDAVIGTCVTIGGRSGQVNMPDIGKGAMIGTGSKVLSPVRVGQGASVGANAVVLHDIPDFAVAVGAPARVIRVLAPHERPDYKQFVAAGVPGAAANPLDHGD